MVQDLKLHLMPLRFTVGVFELLRATHQQAGHQLDRAASCFRAAGSRVSQHSLYGAYETCRRPGLEDEVVGAHLYAAYQRSQLVMVGEENKGRSHSSGVRLRAPAELVSVHAGHVDVGNDDVEALAPEALPVYITVCGDGHSLTRVLEHEPCPGSLSAAVFDHKNVTRAGDGHAALAMATRVSASPDGRSATSAAPH